MVSSRRASFNSQLEKMANHKIDIPVKQDTVSSRKASLNSQLEKMANHKSDIPVKQDTQPVLTAPLISTYNDRIRPLIDAVNTLRHLNITKEGIELPTIVVVGDQSSGKSSVLESLAGICLPRGQGIRTRVPLIMRLQDHKTLKPDLQLEYGGKVVHTSEIKITKAIAIATNEIAGNGKGISNTPLTLIVKKKGPASHEIATYILLPKYYYHERYPPLTKT